MPTHVKVGCLGIGFSDFILHSLHRRCLTKLATTGPHRLLVGWRACKSVAARHPPYFGSRQIRHSALTASAQRSWNIWFTRAKKLVPHFSLFALEDRHLLATVVLTSAQPWHEPGGSPGMASKPRGAFILFEGLDRSGKSTQCRRLFDALQQEEQVYHC